MKGTPFALQGTTISKRKKRNEAPVAGAGGLLARPAAHPPHLTGRIFSAIQISLSPTPSAKNIFLPDASISA
jgi:hypothetical protein